MDYQGFEQPYLVRRLPLDGERRTVRFFTYLRGIEREGTAHCFEGLDMCVFPTDHLQEKYGGRRRMGWEYDNGLLVQVNFETRVRKWTRWENLLEAENETLVVYGKQAGFLTSEYYRGSGEDPAVGLTLAKMLADDGTRYAHQILEQLDDSDHPDDQVLRLKLQRVTDADQYLHLAGLEYRYEHASKPQRLTEMPWDDFEKRCSDLGIEIHDPSQEGNDDFDVPPHHNESDG